ncbi:hypothetical protein SDC9_110621 [bioreactor metagenome]|uniref:Membrane fusion protein n=1 Tax=bioreactor metagenome TaxID=1076179 RepID=A0A645BE77_9ZZZZ
MNITRFLKGVFGVILSIFIIIYLFVQFSTTFSYEFVTEHAGINTVQKTLDTVGYFARSEVYVNAPSQGVLYYDVNEGERVGKDQTVVEVYSSNDAMNLQKQIRELDNKISILEESLITNGYVTTDITKIDTKITDLITEINRSATSDKLEKAISCEKPLLTTMNKRMLITKETDFEAKINALKAQKDSLAAGLAANPSAKTSIKTENSGFFTAITDGYETVFTPDIIDKLTVDGFLALTKSKKDVPQNVAGKIVTDYEWYILCPVTKREASDMETGISYGILFPYSDDAEVKANLVKKLIQTNTDTVVLVFKSEYVPAGFSYERMQQARIIKSTYTGLQIPKNALRLVDGKQGVYILSGNTVMFRSTKIIYETDNYYLVEMTENNALNNELSLYDSVIVKGKDLFEGKVVD